MANIETGYKPEFALGAMFAGDNANAMKNQQLLANLTELFKLKKEQEMMPIEQDLKAAQADNYRAQIQKWNRDDSAIKEMANAEKVAKADKIKQEQGMLEDYAALQGFMAKFAKRNQDGSTDFHDQGALEFPKLLENFKTPMIKNMFLTGKQTEEGTPGFSFTPNQLPVALDVLGRANPTLAKTGIEEVKQAGALQRTRETNQTRENIANWVNEHKKAIKAMEGANRKEDLKQQTARYLDLANQETDPEKKAAYYQMAHESEAAAARIAAAAAVAGPGAKMDSALKTVEALTGERLHTGQIGGGGGKPALLTVEDMRKQLQQGK